MPLTGKVLPSLMLANGLVLAAAAEMLECSDEAPRKARELSIATMPLCDPLLQPLTVRGVSNPSHNSTGEVEHFDGTVPRSTPARSTVTPARSKGAAKSTSGGPLSWSQQWASAAQ